MKAEKVLGKNAANYPAVLIDSTSPATVLAIFPVDNFGTVVGEHPDCLLLSGTAVGENPDHVCWDCGR